jgi:hypothetical protein
VLVPGVLLSIVRPGLLEMIPGLRRRWATFSCQECDHIFAGAIPALFEELPGCDLCGSATRIESVLVSEWRRMTRNREEG